MVDWWFHVHAPLDVCTHANRLPIAVFNMHYILCAHPHQARGLPQGRHFDVWWAT